jgi:hypothetical protein
MEYGDPIVFTKSGQTLDEQDLERYYYQHGQFQACCVPWGCACPFNILCWTVGFPLALMSCFKKKISEEDALKNATDSRCIRYILFPTMIVGLSKNENEEVVQCRIYKFSKYPSIKHEVVENIDECLNDGINGCIQSSMISPMSGIIVFGSETRTVFTGGAKEDLRNYETRPVPELRMIVPIDEATVFSKVFEETVEKFRNG